MSAQGNEVRVLRLTLHQRLVGYLAGYQNGRNVLTFAGDFVADSSRPTLSLMTHPAFPNAEKVLSNPWVRTQKLHPVLSNLLPEGALREFIAQRLKVHVDNEFRLLSYLGEDLPGALVATPLAPDDVPGAILAAYPDTIPIQPEPEPLGDGFSLAGVQMKFSMKEKDGRYNLASNGELGDWIVKTPSTHHQDVPLNEYTAMRLAELAGVDIPEIKLVTLDQLDRLPPINLPKETQAYAIKRFDRAPGERIHMEDFAQVLVKYPQEKYDGANYDHIGRVLKQFSGDSLADIQQLARRLLINILLANGDAHLKNWSLLYADRVTPRLSPAYDILTTCVYMESERQTALNLAGNKDWYLATMSHFESWARSLNVPWRLIQSHLNDTLDRARTLWPEALKDLPMAEPHKALLRRHWRGLTTDFRIERTR